MFEMTAEPELKDITRQELIESYERTVSELEQKIPALQKKLSKAIRNNDPGSGLVISGYMAQAFQFILKCRRELDTIKKEG